MCGIAGWLGHVPDADHYAHRVAELLRHRGPDAQGVRHWPWATLVHTRLSIIDLSPTGAQPMSCQDGSTWVIFNGEIYNHRELRRDLEARGHRFRGRSDSEVIAPLYREYGPDFVTKLRGMFAFALLDLPSRRLLLVRDRFGIKPLFYAVNDGRLMFASELRALRTLPDIDDRLNHQALFDYAALFYIPAPDTLFAGIRAVEPSQVVDATLDADGRVRVSRRTYHQWAVTPNRTLSLDEALEHTDDMVTRAVGSQLESDVPLGSLLSGGIDSSLVSAAAQRATGKLHTFNVQFPQGYDETWAARAVADHIGSRHDTLSISEGEATWTEVTDVLRSTGQPFADTSLFAVRAVSHLMRRHVTVALSGDGGDEGFGGYDEHWRLPRMARLRALPPWLWRSAAAGVAPLAHRGVVRSWLPERLRDAAQDGGDAFLIRNMCCGLREAEQYALCPDLQSHPTRRLFESIWPNVLDGDDSLQERLSAHFTEVNMRLILANCYLFKVDTASMQESLEVRVPLLDEDLMAFALTLPYRLKVNGRTGKRVLRALATKWLPQAVANKPKMGFGTPVDAWVDRAFKQRLRETLLSPSSPVAHLFRQDVYRPWIEAFCDGRQHPSISRNGLYYRTVMLLALHVSLCSSES